MYKYLLDKNKNLFYPLIDDKSIVNVNTINDVQLDEIFNPMVEDILIEDEYRFSVGQYPSASIGVECIPERAGRQAYLDVTTSNPDCCRVSYIDGNTIVLSANRRGESTITITETNSGLSKEARVFIQSIPRLYASGKGPLYTSSSILQESFDEAVYRVEARSNSSSDQFSHWSDGSTENPREITIYEDTYLTAYYKPILCKIEVRSSNNDWGTVRGGGSVRYGGSFMIKAIPNSGYQFVLWSDGDTNPERETWASGDVVFEAIFEELNPNLVIYYTSNDGLVILPRSSDFWANLVENTYTNGQGVMVFNGDITSIGFGAFQDYSTLASVTIPESVTSIENKAFYNCSSLTSVIIPESIRFIGTNAFGSIPATSIIFNAINCDDIRGYGGGYDYTYGVFNPVNYKGDSYNTTLKLVIFGEKVRRIPGHLLYCCSAITDLIIPASVTEIGSYALNKCQSLSSITCHAITPPPLDWSNELSSVTVVYVPALSVNAYKTAWSYYANKIKPIPS